MNSDGSITLAYNLSSDEIERLRYRPASDSASDEESPAGPARPPVAPTRTYRGIRRARGNRVEVIMDGEPVRLLNPRLDLYNHSPTGLEWGYPGSGPAQLALAILADATGNHRIALAWHQDFKRAIVAKLAYEQWEITRAQILAWLVEAAKQELGGGRKTRPV